MRARARRVGIRTRHPPSIVPIAAQHYPPNEGFTACGFRIAAPFAGAELEPRAGELEPNSTATDRRETPRGCATRPVIFCG